MGALTARSEEAAVLSLFQRAFALEDTRPEQALTVYGQLEKQIVRFHPRILIIAALGPALTFTLASYASRAFPGRQTLITLVLGALGFSPAFLLFYRQLLRNRQADPKGQRSGLVRAVVAVVMGFIYLIGDLLVFGITLIIAGILSALILVPAAFVYHLVTGAPFLWPSQLPPALHLSVFIPCLLLSLAVGVSHVDIRPLCQFSPVMGPPVFGQTGPLM